MDLPGLSYLFTLAELSVTFVGFSSLVVVLRQTMGGEMSKLDILITRIFIQLGFIVAAGAMLPALFSLFHLSQPTVWRVASLIPAIPAIVFAATYPTRRRAASGVAAPLAVWIDVVIILLAVTALLGNAAGWPLAPGAGPLAAGLTGILFVSGWAYLQALNTLLRHHAHTRR
jgi:hypothetical protein